MSLPPRALPVPDIVISDVAPERPRVSERQGNQQSVLGSATMPTYDPSQSLEAQLLYEEVQHDDGTNCFWPTQTWKALVTRESVKKTLVDCGIERDKARELSKRIFDQSCERFFTILAIIHETTRIEHVLDCKNGIRDSRLPLVIKKSGGRKGLFFSNGASTSCCLQGLPLYKIPNLESYQWRLDVPRFKLGPKGVVEHQRFNKKAILPWIEAIDKPGEAKSGGYGTVTQVRIHPLCHEYHEVLESVRAALEPFFSFFRRHEFRVSFD